MGEMSKYSPDGGLNVLDIKDANTRKSIAPILTSTTAPSDIVSGKEFYLPDMKLYKATAFIASGATITVGTNCKLADSITDQIIADVPWAAAGKSVKKNYLPYPIGTRQIIDANGVITDSANYYLSDYIPVDSDMIFTWDSFAGSVGVRFAKYDSSKAFIERPMENLSTQTEISIPVSSTVKYLRICYNDSSANYITKGMLRPATIADSNYEPFIYDNTELLSYADNGVLGAKNALSATLEEVKDINTYGTWSGNVYTLYGTSFTVYTDDYGYVNKVTATGAPTANAGLVLKRNFTLDNDYIVNGIIGGSNSTYLISILVSGSTYITDFDGDKLVPKGTYQTLTVSIRANYNPNGKEFYPMLRLATDTDPTFQPFAQTNRELTVNKADNTVIAPVENGTTIQNPSGYAVGSHAIRNGAFITWKNAKAQGESINDASDYTSGDVGSSLLTNYLSLISDLSKIPFGIGYVSLTSAISPTGANLQTTYILFGTETFKTLMIYVGGQQRIYVNRYSNGEWGGWYYTTLTAL